MFLPKYVWCVGKDSDVDAYLTNIGRI